MPRLSRAARSRFLFAPDIASAASHHPLGHGLAPLVRAAEEASILVIDELGGERDVPGSAVFSVLHKRHSSTQATIVTSGLTDPELVARYGGGIERRLFEGALVIRLGAVS